jgi:hypothetical protein
MIKPNNESSWRIISPGWSLGDAAADVGSHGDLLISLQLLCHIPLRLDLDSILVGHVELRFESLDLLQSLVKSCILVGVETLLFSALLL